MDTALSEPTDVTRKGGGVCILISTRCKYKRRKDLEEENSASFESCFVELRKLEAKSDYWKYLSSLLIRLPQNSTRNSRHFKKDVMQQRNL